MKKIALFVATLGIGTRMPFMGTVGSVLSLPVCFVAVEVSRQSGNIGWIAYLTVTLLVFVIGIISVPIAEKMLGPRLDPHGKVREHDQNQIAIDETLGMLITAAPLLFFEGNALFYVLVLLLFRIFDIIKIWPTRIFDRMESAWGVMLDDAVAGTYAAICVFGAIKFLF